MGGGLIVSLLGLAAAAVGFLTTYGLRLGPVPIPLSIVGPLVAVGGIVVMVISFNQRKCLKCQQSLELAQAYFPLEDQDEVLDAVNGELSRLDALGVGTPAEAHVQVSVEFCDTCNEIAVVEVKSFNPEMTHLLEKTLTGSAVPTLAEIIQRHEADHEAAYEAQRD